MTIKQIRLPLPFRMGSVNSFLVKTNGGFYLIDTGGTNNRKQLLGELDREGCKTGNLKLIIITHGDFDHAGNAAYLREKFNTKIAMHIDDSGMVERGDMFWNRKSGGVILGKLISMFSGFGAAERFTPDITVGDGYNLAEYGLNAVILSLPGHSSGSIGILMNKGDMFCGDLLENIKQPGLNSIMDDKSMANASVEKLRGLDINTVYPGHGEPFAIVQII